MEIHNFRVFDSTLFHLEDIEKAYMQYLDKLDMLSSDIYKAFLSTLESQELLSTQTMEIDNSFLINLYNNMQDENPFDYLCDMFKSDITLEQIDKLHSILVYGTKADKEQNVRYRNGDYESDYDKWVGYYENGHKVIQYIPPSPSEVMKYMESIVYFINNSKERSLLYNIFIKSFVLHLGIATVQPFGDGNTRTARLLQSGNVWKETNQCLGKNIARPVLYTSHRYKLYAGTYRKNIQSVVKEKSNDAWNWWFEFNLNMFDEIFYKSNNDLDYVLKHVK